MLSDDQGIRAYVYVLFNLWCVERSATFTLLYTHGALLTCLFELVIVDLLLDIRTYIAEKDSFVT